MKRGRFCPDCGSPAEGNPCWYFLHREYDTSDPPCYCRAYDRDMAELTSSRVWTVVRIFAAVIALAVAVYAAILYAAQPPIRPASPPPTWGERT